MSPAVPPQKTAVRRIQKWIAPPVVAGIPADDHEAYRAMVESLVDAVNAVGPSDAMTGQVRIHSQPGEGTKVALYLPRHDGGITERGAPIEDIATMPRAERGETVLVVDDEPAVRMLVADVLSDLGYVSVEAADGAAGLKILRSDIRVDLLVTDVGLPGGMNGRQVADAARVLRPDLKVLFITGYAETTVMPRPLLWGNGNLDPGMAILTKPFAMDQLAGKIRTLIED